MKRFTFEIKSTLNIHSANKETAWKEYDNYMKYNQPRNIHVYETTLIEEKDDKEI
ncbi:MAG: hypothetical protein WC877_01950 [Dehalococcoidales bacterium]|jgi:hypothetical protein